MGLGPRYAAKVSLQKEKRISFLGKAATFPYLPARTGQGRALKILNGRPIFFDSAGFCLIRDILLPMLESIVL